MKTIAFNELPEDVQQSIAALPTYHHRVRKARCGNIISRPDRDGGNKRGWCKVVDIPESKRVK